MANRHDFTGDDAVVVGEDWVCVLTLPNDNLTGAAVSWQVRATESAPSKLIDLSVSSGIVIDSATQLTATYPTASTASLVPGMYPYDVLVTWSGGLKEVILRGRHEVVRRVSR